LQRQLTVPQILFKIVESTMTMLHKILTLALLSVVHSFTFTVGPVARPSLVKLASTTESSTSTDTTSKGLLKRDRYVATNRFAVRKGQAAKFEKRWATRKSRLATLDGFKYFHLMRRVKVDEDGNCVYDEGEADEEAAGNYVSFTVWNKKSDFSAWRSGEAFKEAHGGTSIGAFLSTMVNSALVLRGAPRPAFYDGLLVQSTKPDTVAETVDGWRNVDADGVNTLPTECFVACNQFFVSPENAAEFEQRWANRESKLKECEGFVAFSMMRRDASAKGHGVVPLSSGEPSYQSTTIWKDVDSFLKWKNGTAFKQAHGSGSPGKDADKSEKPKDPPKPLWNQPPEPVFYEGTLVITSEDGV